MPRCDRTRMDSNEYMLHLNAELDFFFNFQFTNLCGHREYIREYVNDKFRCVLCGFLDRRSMLEIEGMVNGFKHPGLFLKIPLSFF